MNYRNVLFAKVPIILIMMAQVLFSMFFPKRTCTLIPLSYQFKLKFGTYTDSNMENSMMLFTFFAFDWK